jgi:hypothetical protein
MVPLACGTRVEVAGAAGGFERGGGQRAGAVVGLFVGRDMTVLAGSLTGSGVVAGQAAEAARETPPCCESSPTVDRHATGDKPLTPDTDRRGEAASQGTSRRRRRL